MKSIGNPKTFRRLHSDTSASSRLESLSTFSSLESIRKSTIKRLQADVASLKVSSFQSRIFLSDLRFDQLYAYASLFSSMSNFLYNDVGCGSF